MSHLKYNITVKNDISYFSAIDFLIFFSVREYIYMYEHIHKHKNYTGIIIKQKYNEEKVHGSLLIHLKLKKKVMYVKIVMWRKNLIFTGRP